MIDHTLREQLKAFCESLRLLREIETQVASSDRSQQVVAQARQALSGVLLRNTQDLAPLCAIEELVAVRPLPSDFYDHLIGQGLEPSQPFHPGATVATMLPADDTYFQKQAILAEFATGLTDEGHQQLRFCAPLIDAIKWPRHRDGSLDMSGTAVTGTGLQSLLDQDISVVRLQVQETAAEKFAKEHREQYGLDSPFADWESSSATYRNEKPPFSCTC